MGDSAVATGDMQTAAETGGQTKPAYAFQDLSSDPLLSKAPHMEYLGARRPALGGIPLLAKIGQGGMGAVYYGLHPVMGVAVAVKVLPLHLASRNPELARRFVREARIAGSINSANLIYVRDVGEDHGYFYQIMEYVRGVSAGVCLKRLRESGRQGLDEKNALEICIAAAQGLAAAHAKGIIHRDVKPDNILVPVATDERKLLFAAAKLADLGLARMDRGEQPVEATELKESGRRRDESLTVAGAALGTWGYMAAEQANDSRNAGKPADVFSLGATLYALLVGRPPFHGDALMERMLNTILDRKEPVARLRPDVSAATAAVIERCLQKDPAQRYADGAELTTALQECLAAVEAQAPADDVSLNTMSLLAGETVDYTTTAFPEPPAVPPAGQPATLRAGRAVNTVLLVAGVVLAVTGAGLLGFHYWRHAQAEREAKQEAFVAALEHAHEAGRNHAWDSVQPILDKPLAELGMIEDPRRQEAQALIEEANTELKKRADVAAAEEKTRAAAQQKTRAAFTAKMREADGHLANKRWAEAKAAYEEAKGIWPASPDLGAAEAGIGQAQKGAEAAAAEEKTRAAFTTKMKEADGHLANKRWAEAKAA
ncbi:MAG: serine/threonine-protein kinase, partial [Planctomycetota bacterium]|nr:serine/threonine-protein kinase [Planctomycetota bacterium]